MSAAFSAAGYDAACGKVTVSNRPDLCEFQCNGAMPAAKSAHKAPILIANEVVAQLKGSELFSSCEAVAPGFINLRLSETALADKLGALETLDGSVGAYLTERRFTEREFDALVPALGLISSLRVL